MASIVVRAGGQSVLATQRSKTSPIDNKMRCKTTVVRRVAVKASQNGDEIDGSGDADVHTARAVQRRAVLSALTAGAAWSATSGAARAAVDVGDYLSNLLVEKPPPPKREILLPELEARPLPRV